MINSFRFGFTATVFVLIFMGLSAPAVLAQREDYKIREVRASVPVRQRLAQARNRIQSRKLTFDVGYTYAVERGVENITGGLRENVSPAVAQRQNALASRLIQIDEDARKAANVAAPKLKLACSANLKQWDWRKEGKVSPIRQQKCGNCWAYAALAAYESNYMIRNNAGLDGSEQYVVSNNTNGAGKCELPGGWASKAIEFLVLGGTTTEAIMPDLGITGTPDPSIASPYDAVAWGWADPNNPGNPGVQKIKESICEQGPVTTWIDAGGTFGLYTGGNQYGDVYNDDDDKEPGYKAGGHFVSIIGWDENRGAWLIRNSWGENWGFEAGYGNERGYGWIKYGTHSVGSDVAWVRAKAVNYQLPKLYYEALPLKRIKINPVLRAPIIQRP